MVLIFHWVDGKTITKIRKREIEGSEFGEEGKSKIQLWTC